MSITGLELLLNRIGGTNKLPSENVIWIHRKFTDYTPDGNKEGMEEYFDLMQSSLDDRAGELLKNLTNQLKDTVEPPNR